jgi:hypothetical protein
VKFAIVGERDGAPKTCGSCRYWSEMIAKLEGLGPMQALCLGDGPLNNRYTTERQTCPGWKSGHFGAVDTPGLDGTEYDEVFE